MTTLAVPALFVVATLLVQSWLRGRKVQTHAVGVAAIHFGVALPTLLVLAPASPADAAGSVLFWTGAGLAWFVVRSHLESSILFALLDDAVAANCDAQTLLQRFHARAGLRARLDELAAAGLVEARDGRPVATRRAERVIALFARLGG